ncbi:MAG: DUF2141 domain-containing protein [bacterium]|nr:DUF2141 domain-containing protein [bacterium]
MSPKIFSNAQDNNIEVPVLIEGIETERGGELLVMLFRRDGFPTKHDRALSIRRLPANTKTVRVSVPIPAEGEEFAIKILHDQDRNGKVTKNFIGIPAEGLGFSNGAVLNFGPPKFKAARIARADAGKVQRIRLQYL